MTALLRAQREHDALRALLKGLGVRVHLLDEETASPDLFYVMLDVSSSQVLFDDERAHLHSTSILRPPVFVAGKNFTGHASVVTQSALASAMVRGIFLPELASLPGALIVPIGDYVSGLLQELAADGLVDAKRCLFGFPHPSGANGHRKSRFEKQRQTPPDPRRTRVARSR